MNKTLERGEMTAFFTFAFALLFMLLSAWVHGCGDNSNVEVGEVTVAPVVEIHCDEPVGEPRCFILVWGADTVKAHYGYRLGWWDENITEHRVVYVDSPPPAVRFTVEACNEVGCTTAHARLDGHAGISDEAACEGAKPECSYGRVAVCYCNDEGCRWLCAANRDVFKLAQGDDDPIGCDPDLGPCPTEAS